MKNNKYICFAITLMYLFLFQTTYAQTGYAWKKLGNGMVGSACSGNSILVCKYIDGNLYIAVKNKLTNEVAINKWDGSSWSTYPVIQGNVFISDLEVFNGELYASGNIDKLTGLQRPGNKSLGVIKFKSGSWDSLPSYPTFIGQDSMRAARNLCKYKNKLYYSVGSVKDKLFSLDTFGNTTLIQTHTKIYNSGFNDLDVVDGKLVISGDIDSVMHLKKTAGMFYYDGTNFSFPKSTITRNIDKVVSRNDSQYLVIAGHNLEIWEGDSLKTDISPSAQINWYPYWAELTFKNNFIIMTQDTFSVYFDTDSSKWFYLNGLKSQFSRAVAAGPNKGLIVSCQLFQGAAELTLGGIVRGNIFADLDSNCTFNGADKPLDFSLIEFDNGTDKSYTNSDINGNYEISVLAGTHNVTYYLPEVKSSIAPCSTVKVTVATSSVTNNVNIPVHPSKEKNLGVNVNGVRGFLARQGFTETIVLKGGNYGYFKDSLILSLKYPSNVYFINSTITPYSNTGGELIYKLYNVGFREQKTIHIGFSTSTSTIKVGDTIRYYAKVINSAGDSLMDNNYDTLYQRVVAAYDPNIKQSYPEGKVTSGLNKIKYQIHFQNTGNDTAFKVTVVDTITQKLGLRSLRVTGTSHPASYSLRVENKQALIWEFNNIMLPDSHTNEKASHGFIAFEANLNGELAVGDSITNKAYIYFDYQEPIITNYASVLMVKPGSIHVFEPLQDKTLKLYPNPTSGLLHVEIDQQFGPCNVLFFNSLGQMVHTQKVETDVATLDVSAFPKGMYFVNIEGTRINGRLLVE